LSLKDPQVIPLHLQGVRMIHSQTCQEDASSAP
jgi:hypothetical protein